VSKGEKAAPSRTLLLRVSVTEAWFASVAGGVVTLEREKHGAVVSRVDLPLDTLRGALRGAS